MSGASAVLANFTVTKTNPSGNIVRFTITDAAGLLTTSKMKRAVVNDAIEQWITLERADLNTNGDDGVKGGDEYGPRSGDGFSRFTYNYDGLYAQVTLTALTSISSTGTITAGVPYADVN